MSTTADLGNAIEGLIDLLACKQPEIAIVPEKPKEGNGLSKAVNSLGRMAIEAKEDFGHFTFRYIVFQFDIKAIQTRVHRYTAQKARFLSNEAEGDMVNMLALTPDEELTFNEFLEDAVSDIYGALSGYSRRLPFKACLLDEGVDIEVLTTAEVKARTFTKDSYIRVKDTETDPGKIYLALQDVPVNMDITNEDYWKPQPEYIDTKGRVTFAIAEDKGCVPTWDIQTMEIVWDNIKDYLFYSILYQWHSMAEKELEMNMNLLKAGDALGNIKIGLDNKQKRHSRKVNFNGGDFY